MTFTKAAWAIDGPVTKAALARTQAYAACSGQEGVVQKGDLVVTPLSTPGNGVQISAGAALILNRYKGGEGVSDEMYTVTNPTVHTITSGDMPAATGGTQTYIVCVSVGDAEFSQTGHPWMLSTDPPAGTESTFTYVRPIVVTEAAFNARTWPAVAIAKITRPGATTTITSGMIDSTKEVRKLARPRWKLEQAHVAGPASANPLNVVTPTTERWPTVTVLEVLVPSWAVKAKIHGFVEGVRLTKTGSGVIRPYVEGTALQGSPTNIDEVISGTGNNVRRVYNVGGEINVTSIAGTTAKFSIKGFVDAGGSSGFVTTDTKTSVFLSVLFEEEPV